MFLFIKSNYSGYCSFDVQNQNKSKNIHIIRKAHLDILIQEHYELALKLATARTQKRRIQDHLSRHLNDKDRINSRLQITQITDYTASEILAQCDMIPVYAKSRFQCHNASIFFLFFRPREKIKRNVLKWKQFCVSN